MLQLRNPHTSNPVDTTNRIASRYNLGGKCDSRLRRQWCYRRKGRSWKPSRIPKKYPIESKIGRWLSFLLLMVWAMQRSLAKYRWSGRAFLSGVSGLPRPGSRPVNPRARSCFTNSPGSPSGRRNSALDRQRCPAGLRRKQFAADAQNGRPCRKNRLA